MALKAVNKKVDETVVADEVLANEEMEVIELADDAEHGSIVYGHQYIEFKDGKATVASDIAATLREQGLVE